MTQTVDAVVLGVGGMGAAALYHLARRGLRVVGVEQHGVPHTLGASHGHSRVIRKAYYEDPRYVPLLERSYALWRELEAESGAELLRLTGCLNIGRREHPHVQGVLASAAQHKLAHEVLDATEIARRFPIFAPGAHDIGVFEADGGMLSPEACTRAHADVAVRAGASLVLRERVVDLALGDAGGVITTDHGTRIAARHVVVSAGPWWATLPFLRVVGRALVIQRQVQCWFPARPAEPMPAFIQFLDDGRAFYGLPPAEGHGVKVCRHGGGARTTADAIDRNTVMSDAADVREFLRAHMPTVDAEPEAMAACLYSMTPDQHFLVGALPEHPHVVVLGGFSGHGYKMASVMGEIAADLVQHRETAHDIAMFAPTRFG